ncbi:hypothetical protein QAD02_002939 [Eretmocerus hayati]|uniref:Uncharacterized protein n=1 Tax=Eretmocerus hayati TaxID=131215 RepID=A0ACC2NKB0_9HYME|nr:hypothetical protein QAD02_002939 [Eretmocerus hayati]
MEVPTEIIETLALGPKFSQPSSLEKISTIETVKNIEKLLDTYELDEQLAWTLRSHIVGNIYTQTKKPIPHITQESRISTRKIKAAREFARDNKIMFTMADKGNITVAMESDTYREKMKDLLSDKNTYSVVKKKPLSDLQSKHEKMEYDYLTLEHKSLAV